MRESTRALLGVAVVGVVATIAGNARGGNLFSPTDRVVAIDRDATPSTTTQSPTAEQAPNLIDYDASDATNGWVFTKYLHFGKEGTGVIVTANNAAVAKRIGFINANDAPERDPLNFRVYGTNAAITSTAYSGGAAEPWTFITSGATGIQNTGANFDYYADFASNTQSFKSYKVLFTVLRNNITANSMQLAEMQLYDNNSGTFFDNTGGILAKGNPILPIDAFESRYPTSGSVATQGPNKAIDGDLTSGSKYLNFGKQNSGFVVTPSRGSTIAHSFQITTANDVVARDPTSIEIWGTNGSLLEPDNGDGNENTWTLIYSGALALPDTRNTTADPIGFDNNTAYSQYKIIFPTVKDAVAANSMQISEFVLSDTIVPVPEPGAAGLLALGLFGLRSRRRRA